MLSSRLSYFPVSFFGSVMGMGGLAIALNRYGHAMGLSLFEQGGRVILSVASGWFTLLLLIYLAKCINHFHAVHEEWKHPVRKNFFAAISISLLLLAIGYADHAPIFSRWIWYIGAALHFWFLLQTVRGWILQRHTITMINPAWFIPVVGTILVPVVGTSHANPEIAWFFFSIGIIYWLLLLTVVIYRIIFHDPIPERLFPTLFILIAPPAVGFIAYTTLTGSQLDPFCRILYYQALFTAVLLASLFNTFRKVPFSLAWWAYTFPLAALTLATIRFSHSMPGQAIYSWLATVFLTITLLVIAIVAALTIRAAWRKQICIPET